MTKTIEEPELKSGIEWPSSQTEVKKKPDNPDLSTVMWPSQLLTPEKEKRRSA